METVKQTKETKKDSISWPWPSNDNSVGPLSMGKSVFPDDAVARIYRVSRPVTTAGKARKSWRLVFERRTTPFIEPLMGYIGGDDPLTQVELEFPDLESAIGYAKRQGLTYVVRPAADRSKPSEGSSQRPGGASHAFSDATSSGSDLLGSARATGSRSTVRQAAATHPVRKAGRRPWRSSGIRG